MSRQYTLVKQTPVPCKNLMEWGQWMQNGVRHVGDKTKRNVRVSTVFLGLDHNYGEGEPILFETIIFGGMRDQQMRRYSTMNQAREGHRQVVKLVIRETK